MNSSRSEIISTWAVALALIAAIAIRGLLPDLPPRRGAARSPVAVWSGETAALAAVPTRPGT